MTEKMDMDAAIRELFSNPPPYATKADIKKARTAARRQYRQDLTEVIRNTLNANQTINIKDIIEATIADVVAKVSRRVDEALSTAGTNAETRLKAEVSRLVQENLKKNGVSQLNALITEEVTAYAKKFVEKNILINIKEGTW